jgi:hypothetical protein
MKRSILKSCCLVTALFAVPARVLAVWPPSTSFVAEAEASRTGTQTPAVPPEQNRDVQALTTKLEQDEERLEKVIRDLKDDQAALKALSQDIQKTQGGSRS